MQALIDFLIRNLMALWPLARVNEWNRAILVRLGKIRRETSCAPGSTASSARSAPGTQP